MSFILLLGLGLLVSFYVVYIRLNKNSRNDRELLLLRMQHQNEVLRSQVEMQEQTFTNVARDIHDNIGQKLSLIKMNTENAKKNSSFDLTNTSLLISEVIADLRNLSRSMSADLVRNEGFVAALRGEALLLQKTGRFNVSFDIKGEDFFLKEDTEIILFRICQEALQNVIKHSSAQNVSLSLCYEQDHLTIVVSDDGKGFTGRSGAGSGLKNIRMRTAALGGVCSINSSDTGTMITVAVRLSSEDKFSKYPPKQNTAE